MQIERCPCRSPLSFLQADQPHRRATFASANELPLTFSFMRLRPGAIASSTDGSIPVVTALRSFGRRRLIPRKIAFSLEETDESRRRSLWRLSAGPRRPPRDRRAWGHFTLHGVGRTATLLHVPRRGRVRRAPRR